MKTLSRLVLWFIITLYSFAFSGCTSEPIMSIDASVNTLNMGAKKYPSIYFRTKE